MVACEYPGCGEIIESTKGRRKPYYCKSPECQRKRNSARVKKYYRIHKDAIGGRIAFPQTTPEERQERVETLRKAVIARPGKTASVLGKLLGWPPGAVNNVLLLAEEMSVLFWEDDRGGLYAVE